MIKEIARALHYVGECTSNAKIDHIEYDLRKSKPIKFKGGRYLSVIRTRNKSLGLKEDCTSTSITIPSILQKNH